MSLQQSLADLVVDTRLSAIGGRVKAALHATVLDTVGCIGLAAQDEFADQVVDAALTANGGGRCSIAGRQTGASPAAAAMVNATLGHGYDYDDAHLPSVAHFSTIVIPAAMVACEMENAGGREFLEAVLVGDEVGGRLGALACSAQRGGSAIRSEGFFPTSVLATVAAAAACAKVFRLDRKATSHALSIACSYASGLAGISKGDSSSKRTQTGWAAQAGLCAAQLARSGFTGPPAVFESDQGFVAAFMGPETPRQIDIDPAEGWICEQMSFKPYPVEYVLHPLVELATQARRTRAIDLARVTDIEVAAPARFVSLFEPAELKCSPQDAYAAALSGPYCIARALSKEGTSPLTLDDFRNGFQMNDVLRGLAAKVRFTSQPWIDEAFPRRLAGSMRVRSEQVVLFDDVVRDVYGSPARPLSGGDLDRKFHENLRASRVDAGQILDLLHHLEDRKDAGWIAAALGSLGSN